MNKIRAAHVVLGAMSRVSGSFREVFSGGRRVTVTVEDALKSRPRSIGGLRWASDTGHYRDVRVGSPPKLYRIYFGSWGKGARLSAYVVVFRRGKPQLEVRLSPRRDSAAGPVSIRHRLAFFGKRYRAPTELRDYALRLAERSGIPVDDRQALLGAFDANGRTSPSPRVVLRRILTCGLIKSVLIEAAQSGQHPRLLVRKRHAKVFKRKRERFPKGRRLKIDLLLDRRFEAHGRHNRLINLLQESLEAKGYHVDDQSPYDLVATRRGRAAIIEVKGWGPKQLVGAVRTAVGQLMYYTFLFKQDEGRQASMVAALTYTPAPRLVSFAEETARIGLLWLDSDGRFRAGTLARRLLPGLIDG